MNDVKINLIAQSETIKEIDTDKDKIIIRQNEVDNEISSLKNRSQKIKEKLKDQGVIISEIKKSDKNLKMDQKSPEDLSYEEVTKLNKEYIKEKDLEDFEFDSLFTEDEIKKIELGLAEPIKREKWDKWDFIAVLMAGISGSIADFFTGSIDTQFKDFLKGYKINSQKVSIDYQGAGFGGGHHRVLSSGHDIMRIFSALWQIKNGTFVGLKQVGYDKFEWITSTVNSKGNTFDTYDGFSALLIYIKHMISDFITPESLPPPGISYLIEMPDHEIRKFAIGLYTHGFNLRYILVQILAPAIVEVIIRLYVFGREFINTGEITFPTARKLKTTELLLVSHAFVMGVNVGKVAIKTYAGDPYAIKELNVFSIIATVRYFIPFVQKRLKLNDHVEIIIRNAKNINEKYDEIVEKLKSDLENDKEFVAFLHNGEILTIE